MAANENLFRKESMDQLSRQSRTGPYVSTTHLKAWLVLAAVLILLVTSLVWSFAGTLPVSITCKGFAGKDGPACFLLVSPQVMQTREIDPGDAVRVTRPTGVTIRGTVRDVSAAPLTLEELSGIVDNDWIFHEVQAGDYNYCIDVELESDLKQDEMVDAVITVEHVRPIALLLES